MTARLLLIALVGLCLAAPLRVGAQELRPETTFAEPTPTPADQSAGANFVPSAGAAASPSIEAPPSLELTPPIEANPPRGHSPGARRAPFRLSASWLPVRDVEGQAADLGMTGLLAELAVPVRIAPDGRSIWLAMSSLEHLTLDTDAILPDSLIAVPDNLWKVNFGGMHRREFDNGWKAGGLLTVGTASDRPFADLEDLTLTSVGFVEVPWGSRDAWNFSLFYSPTSQLPFPIPGIAYVWRPSERLTANIGVPFSLRYDGDLWAFSADYRPLTAVNLRAARKLGDGWQAYARYEIVNDIYWLAERTNSHDRLFLFDQRAAVGVERALPGGFALDVSAAYVFDRSIFQAESFSDDRRDELHIAPGAAVSVMLLWRR